MTVFSRDTTPEAEAVHREVLHRLGPEGRVKMAFELSDSLRETICAGVRHRHPDWDERRVKLDMIRLTIGDKLFREVYGQKGGEA